MSLSTPPWRQAQLEALLELSLALGGPREEAELVEELVHRAVGLLDARRGLVVALSDQGGLSSWAAVNWPGSPEEFLVACSRYPGGLEVGLFPGSELALPCQQIMVAAGSWQGQWVLLVAVADRETRGGQGTFAPEDLPFLRSLALVAASAVASSRALAEEKRRRRALEEENRSLRGDFGDFIAESPAMRRVLELARRVAPLEVSVLLRGESGTGKEKVARLLHQLSPRAGGPFVPINCAAVPESLLEAELFGIDRGVATGVEARIGKLEVAHGGTLFLDEVGDLSPNLQAKLLRVLQERTLERVGGRREVRVDVRVVAATHRDLETMLARGEFRQDLYYRLRVVELRLPPLRQRPEDIPRLIQHFLQRFAAQMGKGQVRLEREAWQLLLAYDYPGNVRELEHLVEASLALAEANEVRREDVLLAMGSSAPVAPLGGTLEEVVKGHVLRTLERLQGNKKEAAKALGVDRTTLYRMLKRWNAT
ncbi:MAG: sigma 54-interacting transcriptional regulator [Thermoanaerobaculum sp.]|nr:sigma 54-interacting transcriptional regulator [Thermoanaerobaculum sp.]